MRRAKHSCSRKTLWHALGPGRRNCRGCGGTKPHRGRTFSFEPLEERAMHSVCVWDGDGGNNRWSNPANWRAGVAPRANDDLVFGRAALTQTENDLPAGMAFRSLSFLSQDYSIAGSRLGVTSRLVVGPWTPGATIAAVPKERRGPSWKPQ